MKFAKYAVVALVGVSACASSEPSGDLKVYVDEDGNIISVDGENPALADIAALLGGAMNGESDAKALKEDDIWSADSSDNLQHIQSGGICPMNWGSFIRTNNVTYSNDGSNVGCGYESAELYTIVTFYFYKNPEPIKQEFKGVMDLIRTRNPVHQDSSFTNIFSNSVSGFSYLADAISYENSSGALIRSGALLSERDGWRIKMRITYPADYAPQIESIVTTMQLAQYDKISEDGITPDHPSEENVAEQEI